jgi:hypothetical protein
MRVATSMPLGWPLLSPVLLLKLCRNTEGTWSPYYLLHLTMNSVTTLMAPHNTEGGWVDFQSFASNHELCHHADGVTQH